MSEAMPVTGLVTGSGTSLPLDHRLPTALGFVGCMVAKMKNEGWRFEEAFPAARSNFLDFLSQSRVQFGDPRYGWTVADAFNLVEEYRYD